MLDHERFPHVFDRILDFVPPKFFRTLRRTSWAMYHRANAVLYAHVSIAVASGFGLNEFGYTVYLSTPYRSGRGRRLPGLNWDPSKPGLHALTLLRLQAYTRVVDDYSSVETLESAEAEETCSLLAALERVRIVRASPLDGFDDDFNPSWTATVCPAWYDDDGAFSKRVSVTRTLLGDTTWDVTGPLPLLPASTSIAFKWVQSKDDPIIHTHGHLPTVTTGIFNVGFLRVPKHVWVIEQPGASLPPSLTDVVVVFSDLPHDHSWRDAGNGPNRFLGVLHTVVSEVSKQTSYARTVTMVGLEDMDPLDYGITVGPNATWDERKAELEKELCEAVHASAQSSQPSSRPRTAPAARPPNVRPAIIQAIQTEALRTLGLDWEDPNATWPAQFHPFVQPSSVDDDRPPKRRTEAAPLDWRCPAFRLLTHAEWRREVGIWMYTLATTKTWDIWPDDLPQPRRD